MGDVQRLTFFVHRQHRKKEKRGKKSKESKESKELEAKKGKKQRVIPVCDKRSSSHARNHKNLAGNHRLRKI